MAEGTRFQLTACCPSTQVSRPLECDWLVACAHPTPEHSPARCAVQAKAFSDCMSYHNGDMPACQEYFEKMQQCRLALQ